MKTRHVLTLVISAAVFAAMSAAVAADTADKPGGKGQHQGACAKDVERLCPGVQPGEGRIVQCMKAHQNEVSPECKTDMQAKEERFKHAKEACQGDVDQFCKGVDPGEGRIMHCLKEHESQISAKCRSAFPHDGKQHG